MRPILSAVIAPVRFGALALAGLGRGVSMLFARAGGWQLLLSRTRFDYRREVGDPATNSIVGALVGWIARNFPEAPVRIVREGAGTDDPGIPPGPSGPGYMLRLIERPNRYFSGVLQWMATLVDFICDGNAYWIKIRNAQGRVVELWWVPRSMIEPKWPENDPSVFIGWYEYTVDGRVYRISPDDVVHFRNGIDPTNPRKGLSRLASLFREIFTDDEASNFTASLLRNLGVPGVIIAPANTTASSGRVAYDADDVKKTFVEKFGGDKRGEPMVMTAPTEVKVLSWSPEQMNLRELRRIPEERASAVIGVPAGVAGLGAGLDRNTFSNYGEANVAAYTQGVIPLQRLMSAELEVQLLVEFVDLDREPLDVWFDWRVVSAFATYFADVWRRTTDAATKGLMTRAAWMRAVGQKPAADGSDDVFVVPNNYVFMPAGGSSGPPPSGRQPAGQLVPVQPADAPPANGHSGASVGVLTSSLLSGRP